MALHFILVRPKEPGNVGSTARAMKNFGYSNLRLVAPQRPLNKNAYAFASHAGDVLDNALTYPSLKDALANITVAIGTTARARKYDRSNYAAKEAADIFTKLTPTQDIALVFGPEDWGLSNEDLDLCQGYIQIPTANYASLNLAQAVQVLAYEFFQSDAVNTQSATANTQSDTANSQSNDTSVTEATLVSEQKTPVSEQKTLASEQTTLSPTPSPEEAIREALLQKPSDDKEQMLSSRKQIEGMYEQLHDVLQLTGYTDEQRAPATMRLMRRVFDKATLTERELKAIRGLWRQVMWATKDELKDELKEKRNA